MEKNAETEPGASATHDPNRFGYGSTLDIIAPYIFDGACRNFSLNLCHAGGEFRLVRQTFRHQCTTEKSLRRTEFRAVNDGVPVTPVFMHRTGALVVTRSLCRSPRESRSAESSTLEFLRFV